MKPADVQIVDDLGHQVVDGFDECHIGFEVGQRAQLREHFLAEPVGSLDRRCVEVRDRLGEAVASLLDGVGVTFQQQLHDLVAAVLRDGPRERVRQRPLG